MNQRGYLVNPTDGNFNPPYEEEIKKYWQSIKPLVDQRKLIAIHPDLPTISNAEAYIKKNKLSSDHSFNGFRVFISDPNPNKSGDKGHSINMYLLNVLEDFTDGGYCYVPGIKASNWGTLPDNENILDQRRKRIAEFILKAMKNAPDVICVQEMLSESTDLRGLHKRILILENKPAELTLENLQACGIDVDTIGIYKSEEGENVRLIAYWLQDGNKLCTRALLSKQLQKIGETLVALKVNDTLADQNLIEEISKEANFGCATKEVKTLKGYLLVEDADPELASKIITEAKEIEEQKLTTLQTVKDRKYSFSQTRTTNQTLYNTDKYQEIKLQPKPTYMDLPLTFETTVNRFQKKDSQYSIIVWNVHAMFSAYMEDKENEIFTVLENRERDVLYTAIQQIGSVQEKAVLHAIYFVLNKKLPTFNDKIDYQEVKKDLLVLLENRNKDDLLKLLKDKLPNDIYSSLQISYEANIAKCAKEILLICGDFNCGVVPTNHILQNNTTTIGHPLYYRGVQATLCPDGAFSAYMDLTTGKYTIRQAEKIPMNAETALPYERVDVPPTAESSLKYTLPPLNILNLNIDPNQRRDLMQHKVAIGLDTFFYRKLKVIGHMPVFAFQEYLYHFFNRAHYEKIVEKKNSPSVKSEFKNKPYHEYSRVLVQNTDPTDINHISPEDIVIFCNPNNYNLGLCWNHNGELYKIFLTKDEFIAIEPQLPRVEESSDQELIKFLESRYLCCQYDNNEQFIADIFNPKRMIVRATRNVNNEPGLGIRCTPAMVTALKWAQQQFPELRFQVNHAYPDGTFFCVPIEQAKFLPYLFLQVRLNNTPHPALRAKCMMEFLNQLVDDSWPALAQEDIALLGKLLVDYNIENIKFDYLQDKLNKIFERYANIYSVSQDYEFIHHIAAFNLTYVLERYLKHHTNVNHATKSLLRHSERTPLSIAFFKDNNAMIKCLLSNGSVVTAHTIKSALEKLASNLNSTKALKRHLTSLQMLKVKDLKYHDEKNFRTLLIQIMHGLPSSQKAEFNTWLNSNILLSDKEKKLLQEFIHIKEKSLLWEEANRDQKEFINRLIDICSNEAELLRAMKTFYPSIQNKNDAIGLSITYFFINIIVLLDFSSLSKDEIDELIPSVSSYKDTVNDKEIFNILCFATMQAYFKEAIISTPKRILMKLIEIYMPLKEKNPSIFIEKMRELAPRIAAELSLDKKNNCIQLYFEALKKVTVPEKSKHRKAKFFGGKHTSAFEMTADAFFDNLKRYNYDIQQAKIISTNMKPPCNYNLIGNLEEELAKFLAEIKVGQATATNYLLNKKC